MTQADPLHRPQPLETLQNQKHPSRCNNQSGSRSDHNPKRITTVADRKFRLMAGTDSELKIATDDAPTGAELTAITRTTHSVEAINAWKHRIANGAHMVMMRRKRITNVADTNIQMVGVTNPEPKQAQQREEGSAPCNAESAADVGDDQSQIAQSKSGWAKRVDHYPKSQIWVANRTNQIPNPTIVESPTHSAATRRTPSEGEPLRSHWANRRRREHCRTRKPLIPLLR